MCKRIEYTPEVEAIFQIYCPHMDKPDWEFWNEELKETRVWNEEDFHTYKREVFKKDIIQIIFHIKIKIFINQVRDFDKIFLSEMLS